VPTEEERRPAEPEAGEAGDAGESPPLPGQYLSGEESREPVTGNNDLTRLVERLADEVAALRADFAAKIRYDEVKERQIAGMHEELQAFRAGLHLRLLQPVFADLIAMHDDLVDALGPDNAAVELDSFRESVLETLSRNGVSSYSVASDEVDTARQRVIRTVATGDETLDRRVQRRIRVGFEYDNGKVLRPEWVATYRHTANAEKDAATVPAVGGD
jgi:molecular chaperone GrpE (heat shock protein)